MHKVCEKCVKKFTVACTNCTDFEFYTSSYTLPYPPQTNCKKCGKLSYNSFYANTVHLGCEYCYNGAAPSIPLVSPEQKIQELESLNSFLRDQLRKYQKTMNRYKEALEQYANETAWSESEFSGYCENLFHMVDSTLDACNGYELAQKVLKEDKE